MRTKRILSFALLVLCAAAMLICAAACGLGRTDRELLRENATYTEDTTLGEGSKTVYVDVIVCDDRVRITIKTDADNLADALLETGLAEGEVSEYGLYVKKVNGITADYSADAAYWGFCQNGAPLAYGVSAAKISGGEYYELVYSK